MEENNNIEKETIEKEIDFGGRIGVLKKIAIFFIGIILFFLVVLALAQGLISFSNIKTEVNSELASIITAETGEESKYGATAFIEGNVSFTSFPIPHISINNIKGSNLTEKGHNISFEIKKIKIYVVLKNLIAKKIVVNKMEIIDGIYNIKEVRNSEFDIVSKILNRYIEKLNAGNPNAIITLKNNTLNIDGINYDREFNNINIVNNLSKNRVSTVGSLLSNKQPINIDMSLNKSKDEYNGKINLNSQAFKANLELKADFSKKQFSGKSNLDLTHPQLFSRTIFHPSSFLYTRFIDNGNLKINFDFAMLDNIFNIKNIIIDGNNVNGNGNIELNLNDNSNSKVNLNISYLDLDSLIIKDMAGKNKDVNDKNVVIFSDLDYIYNEEQRYKGYIERIIKKNPIDFNIKVKNLKFNNEKVASSEFQFKYSPDEENKFKFERIFSELPGKTFLSVYRQQDGTENLNIKGEDLDLFWNFLKNTSSKAKSKNTESEKNNFEFTGTISTVGNKLFIKDGNFSSKDLNSKNSIEIDFDSGISYIAINSYMDDFVADNYISSQVEGYQINNILKNKILFLNDFTLNSFLKLNIGNLEYNKEKYKNCSFIIRTSRGLLNIYDINLDNKISGSISFDILNTTPKFNIDLNIQNTKITKNVDLNKELFKLPTFEDFNGDIKIVGKSFSFKKSQIDDLNFLAKMTNGVLNISNFEINGFGGKCGITGFLDLKYDRKLNLTFGGCTANLKDTLYLFTNTNNIEGLIGFSSVLYTEGRDLSNFISNYSLRLQIIGSGIIISRFGISKLSSDLFDINSKPELIDTVIAENILYNKDDSTIFEKLSGNIQYNKKTGGQLDFDISRPFINGKITGDFKLFSDYSNINLNANFIMLSGTLQKTVTLVLPIVMVGNTPDNINFATNFQQVNDYISATKKIFEAKTN